MKRSLDQNTFFVYFRYFRKVGNKLQGYFCPSSNINPPYCTVHYTYTITHHTSPAKQERDAAQAYDSALCVLLEAFFKHVFVVLLCGTQLTLVQRF
jgi:hypothetical protein